MKRSSHILSLVWLAASAVSTAGSSALADPVRDPTVIGYASFSSKVEMPKHLYLAASETKCKLWPGHYSTEGFLYPKAVYLDVGHQEIFLDSSKGPISPVDGSILPVEIRFAEWGGDDEAACVNFRQQTGEIEFSLEHNACKAYEGVVYSCEYAVRSLAQQPAATP